MEVEYFVDNSNGIVESNMLFATVNGKLWVNATDNETHDGFGWLPVPWGAGYKITTVVAETMWPKMCKLLPAAVNLK